MLYFYQYDVAAIIALALLLFLYFLRRTYITRSNRIFVSLIAFTFFGALFDWISCFTISFPQNYPMWFVELTSYGYLFFFNMLAVMFFMYIDSQAKIGGLRHISHWLQAFVTIFYAVTILSTHWTHWVAYFDADGSYHHGPLLMGFYVLSFLFFALEVVYSTVARKRFTRYQLVANYTLIVSMTVSVLVQMLFPKMLVCQMIMALILYFIYLAYENPAHYTYRSTTCLNRKAFFETIKYANWRKQVNSIYAIHLADYEYIKYHLSVDTVDRITVKIAEFLAAEFGKQAFVIDDSLFLVLLPGKVGNRDESIQRINDYLSRPIQLSDTEVSVNVDTYLMTDLDEDYKADELEQIIRYRMDHPEERDEEIDSRTLLNTVIENNNKQRQLLHILKRAINNDEFKVYYQPIYEVKTGKFKSAEALLRLIDPELGFINPEELVKLAENNNYIEQVGDLIFRKVCSFLQEAEIKNYGVDYVEINLSPIQCQDERLVPRFMGIMEDYHIEPGQLNMEITETAEIRNEKLLRLNIEDFHRMSVTMSIDDYGSGFASADYLIRLPVSIVKIDKGILWNAMKDDNAMIVLRHTISMLHELGKEIVVEGVETEEMVNLLTDLKVDFLQGYYYSKPIPEADYLEFLKNHQVEE